MSRFNKILLVSIALSVLLHLSFIGVSTKLMLMGKPDALRAAQRFFRTRAVELKPPAPPRPRPQPLDTKVLEQIFATEPGRTVEMPALTEFEEALKSELAREVLGQPPESADRPHRAEDLTMVADLRVIEVAKTLTREEIEVLPRLLRPGGGEIPPPEIVPTFSRPGSEREWQLALRAAAAEEVSKPIPVVPERLLEESKTPKKEPPPVELPALPIEIAKVTRPLVEDKKAIPRLAPLDELLAVTLFTHTPPGEDGYFQVRITPRTDGRFTIIPKDIVFVIDASKSISAAKLDRSKRGLIKGLDVLNRMDRFNLVAFREEPIAFRPELVSPNSDNLEAARKFVTNLSPGGETDVFRALEPYMRRQPERGRVFDVVLISDGKPTVGEVDSRAIINELTSLNELKSSIFTFAGGSDVNKYLLDLLAYRNKGESLISPKVYEISEALPAGFLSKLQYAILTSLYANYGNIDETHIFPKTIPDFYLSTTVDVFGRFKPGTDTVFSMRLTGYAGDEKKEIVFEKRFSDAAPADAELARMWAFRKSYKLVEDICEQGETPALLEELAELDSRYGIRTTYTPEY